MGVSSPGYLEGHLEEGMGASVRCYITENLWVMFRDS